MALLQVIAIDLVLAGDNAIVIGLAAAGLPVLPIAELAARADAGATRPVPPRATGRVVAISEYRDGTVTDVEEDKLTVLFETVGYRTLSRRLVEENGLLKAR